MTPKAEGALRTIGEVAEATGVPTHVLRYWERQVPTLDPLRRAGGRRYYRAEDVETVRRLQHMIGSEGYTLEGAARAVAAGRGRGDVRSVDVGSTAAPQAHGFNVAQLVRLRDRLVQALAAA